MKQTNVLQRFLAVTALPSLIAITFGFPITAIKAAAVQNSPSAANELSSSENDVRLAQTSVVCRQVSARGGLYVRAQPTIDSRILGAVLYGRNVSVTVPDPQPESWVPVSAPIEGYMFSGYLVPCEPVDSDPSNCRQVKARNGLVVREEPSIDSERVGVVPRGRNVTILNLGADGWVPIQVPLEGYVPANDLTYCP
ncbi:MAG: SH3 domain-containing protein [Leptolyngbyaceae cyanobacterium SL_5_9]|nr:SH3 domain-containing protein [Leptolyngbyaceae cyanobacterium SL_5_9]NJO76041.1 SH3 domain-containing protein [Leptolyngbyaceae cyanobacterium RM1_406_9]